MENFLIKMKTLLGDEYEDFLKCCEGENYRGLRVNTLKYTFEKLNSALGFQLRKTPFCKNGAYRRRILLLPAIIPCTTQEHSTFRSRRQPRR